MQFPSTSPLGGGGAYIGRGDLTEGFLHYKFAGLILGGAYFRNFTVYWLFLRDCHFCNTYSYSLLNTL